MYINKSKNLKQFRNEPKNISCDTKMKLTAEPQAPDIQLTPDYNSPNKSCLTWCMAFLFAKKFSEFTSDIKSTKIVNWMIW